MTEIVIDANIAIGWFSEQRGRVADKALDAVSESGAVAPALWRWEVQDVLRRLFDAGHLKIPVQRVLHELRELPIVIDDGLPGLFGNEGRLAEKYRLSAYDAAYLEVALRRRLPLATADKQLAAAARAAGVAF